MSLRLDRQILSKLNSLLRRRARFSFLICFGSVVFAFASAAIATQYEALPSPLKEISETNSAFRKGAHWDGADGAMTVRLSHGKVLWLFGDTWVRSRKNDRSSSRTMINNSVAIEERPVWKRCDHIYEGPGSFDRLNVGQSDWSYWYGNTPDKPESMFKSSEKGVYYWPGCGAVYGDKLFLILKKIRHMENPDPLFAFDWFGEDLLTVTNIDAPPTLWKYTAKALSAPTHEVQFGLGCTTDEKYFYSLCYLEESAKSAKKTILARILLSDLESSKNWQYFCGSDKPAKVAWHTDFRGAKNLFPDGGPEMSLFHHKGLGCFVSVYQAPLSNMVIARFSRKIEGPWSAPLALYDVPPISLKDGQKALVYAGKAHEHLSNGFQIGFTYCANPGGIKEHETNSTIYFPTAKTKKVSPQDVQKLMDAAESSK